MTVTFVNEVGLTTVVVVFVCLVVCVLGFGIIFILNSVLVVVILFPDDLPFDVF